MRGGPPRKPGEMRQMATSTPSAEVPDMTPATVMGLEVCPCAEDLPSGAKAPFVEGL